MEKTNLNITSKIDDDYGRKVWEIKEIKKKSSLFRNKKNKNLSFQNLDQKKLTLKNI